MQEQVQYKLILNSKEFIIPSNFPRLDDISSTIYQSLTEDHQYVVQSFVSEEVFQSFIKYLINNDIPNINFHNKFEYHQLSKEFNIMGNLLIKIQKTKESYINVLKLLKDETNKDKSSFEEIISQNLDDYLENCGEQLLSLPIQSLCRIFNNKNRQLTKQNLCYQLIKSHFEQTNDSNIFVLLLSLDGNRLSKENLEESINLRNDRFGMMPNLEFSFFDEKEAEIEKVLKKQNEDIQNLKAILFELRFNLNEEVESKYFKYDWFIPANLEWTQGKDSTEFTSNSNNQTFKVVSSSTADNAEDHYPKYLFGPDFRWASKPSKSAFIMISFNIPVAANALLMTSREETCYDQAPNSFHVLASNDENKVDVCLRKFSGIEWMGNEKKRFLFRNENQYSCYKIVFTSCKSSGNHYGLSRLNLGKVLE